MDKWKARLVSFSDASLANLKNGGSQGGGIIFIVGENGKYAPLSWNSKKIKRMVKSTIAAETLALLEGSENCFWLGSIIKDMLDADYSPLVFPIRALTDNQSLCDAVHSTKTIEDKRLKIDIGILREMLHKQEISSIEWIDSDKQLADPLTKGGASSNKLIEALNGTVKIC